MLKRLFSLLFVLALVCVYAAAQHGGGGGGGMGGDDSSSGGGGGGGGRGGGGSGVSSGGSDRYLSPKGKSDAETAAAKNLGTVFKDPATTPEQMDAALNEFLTKYPKSDYVFMVQRLGVQYYFDPKHSDLNKLVMYGTKALNLEPQDAYTLNAVGEGVPKLETADDPNLEANLKLADDCNNKILTAARLTSDTAKSRGGGGGSRGGGGSSSPEDAKAAAAKIKQTKDRTEFGAYLSLAKSATLRKKYNDAQGYFDKATAVADFDPEHADLPKAEVLFYQAQSEEAAGQWPAANDSLAQAAKLDGDSPALQKMVNDEQAKIKTAGH